MPAPHLLVHDRNDNVGVVVVEGLQSGTDMLCVVTADDSDFSLRVNAAVAPAASVASSNGTSTVAMTSSPRSRLRMMTRSCHGPAAGSLPALAVSHSTVISAPDSSVPTVGVTARF